MEINVSRIAKFNAMNSAIAPADVIGEPLVIEGLFTFNDDVVNSETGEVENKTLIGLITDKGAISSPSATLVESATKLVEIFEDDVVGMTVKITANKSNSGRTFYRLECIE